MRKNLVLVIGNTFFGRKLTSEIETFEPSLKFVVLQPGVSFFDRVVFVLLLPFCKLVFSVAGSLNSGGSLRLAAILKRPILHEFIGTDVLQVKTAIRENQVSPAIISVSSMFCNAPWLAEEMSEMGFKAPYVPDYVYGIPETMVPLPKIFSVLTYVAEKKESVYGMSWVVSCAKELPQIDFKIAGMNQTDFQLPANVRLLGWVPFLEEAKNSSVVLRLTGHDGQGHTVIEALSLGRWVIRTNAMPGVVHVTSEQSLVEQIRRLEQLFQQGKLTENVEGFEFVKKEFNREKVLRSLVGVIKTAGSMT